MTSGSLCAVQTWHHPMRQFGHELDVLPSEEMDPSRSLTLYYTEPLCRSLASSPADDIKSRRRQEVRGAPTCWESLPGMISYHICDIHPHPSFCIRPSQPRHPKSVAVGQRVANRLITAPFTPCPPPPPKKNHPYKPFATFLLPKTVGFLAATQGTAWTGITGRRHPSTSPDRSAHWVKTPMR